MISYIKICCVHVFPILYIYIYISVVEMIYYFCMNFYFYIFAYDMFWLVRDFVVVGRGVVSSCSGIED